MIDPISSVSASPLYEVQGTSQVDTNLEVQQTTDVQENTAADRVEQPEREVTDPTGETTLKKLSFDENAVANVQDQQAEAAEQAAAQVSAQQNYQPRAASGGYSPQQDAFSYFA